MFKFNFGKPKLIYISHIEQEVIQARALRKDLIALGYNVVLTPHDKSHRYVNHLVHKIIDTVDAVVILTSPSAARSARIWADKSYARMHDVPVIPMVVHQFDGAVPMHTHIQAVDDLQQGLIRLKEALKNKAHYAHNIVAYQEVKPHRQVLRKTVVPVLVGLLTALAAILP